VKLLDRLVLKDLVPQLLIGIGMFLALFVVVGPLGGASRFLSNGIPFSFILRFVLLNTVSFLGYTFPMGMLLSVLLGFGRLSGDSETVALFAGGIPFIRVAVPAAFLGLLVSGVGYIVNDPIASYADKQLVDLRQSALHQQLDTDKPYDLPPIYTSDGHLQSTVHVEKGIDLKNRTLREVTIVFYNAAERPAMVIYARNAQPFGGDLDGALKNYTWQLNDVDITTLGQNAQFDHLPTLNSRKIGHSALDNTPSTLGLMALLHDDPNALPFTELKRAVAQLKAAGLGKDPDVRGADVALWTKIALPLASLVFALVGSPLALRPQRTSKITGWVLSLPIILVYYVLYTIMLSAARGGSCPPALAAFLPDLIGVLVGAGLIWKRSVT
jgi:lipopolysaccharide export system permease protein